MGSNNAENYEVYDVNYPSFSVVKITSLKLCMQGNEIGLKETSNEKTNNAEKNMHVTLNKIEIDQQYSKLLQLKETSKTVRDNIFWKRVYGAANKYYEVHQDPMRSGYGSCGDSEHLESMPCHYCGIYFPMGSIQVDHYQPKKDGLEGAAIIEILYGMNPRYVCSSNSGYRKMGDIAKLTSIQLQQMLSQHQAPPPRGHGLEDVIFPLGLPYPKNENKNLQPTVPKNCVLTFEGIIFLSYVYHLSGCNKRLFIDSILNLVPSCARCNRHKSDLMFSQS